MKRKWVAAIDMGYRNMGFCVLDRTSLTKPVLLSCTDLLPNVRGTPDRRQLFHAIYDWARQNKSILDQCDTIVLETQKSAKFKCMNTVIMSLYPDRYHLLHPFSLCAAYQLPRTRKEKKAATIKLVNARMAEPLIGAKQDDMADAALMALWAVEKKQHAL